MTIAEFAEATSKLEKYYDKAYTTEQAKIMYNTLKEWNIDRYNQAINYCLMNCKFLPKIADLNSFSVNKINTCLKQKFEAISCDKCRDGFIEYYKKFDNGTNIINYRYFCLCTCENGINQKKINGYNLHSYEELRIKI